MTSGAPRHAVPMAWHRVRRASLIRGRSSIVRFEDPDRTPRGRPAPASGSGPSLSDLMLRPRASSTPLPRGLHGGSPAPPAGPPQGFGPGLHQPFVPSNAVSNHACSGLRFATVRQAKPGRGGRHVEDRPETSSRDPAGGKPVRPRVATSRKRVLRGAGSRGGEAGTNRSCEA